MPASEYDVIVVGAGAAGSAAARHLAERGYDVLALERRGIPNPVAASAGVSRIIRLAYHEGERYVPMLRRSLAQWKTLDDRRDERLLRTTGSLAIGPPDAETFTGARDTCRAHGLDHEVLDAAAVGDRFPAYDLSDGYRAVYQPDGGLLDADRCVVALVEAAQAAGGTVRACEPVLDWTADGETARVETTRRAYTADAVVIASGAWAADHVPLLADLLERERHVHCRFQPTSPEQFAPDAFPAFVIDTADGDHFYGLPVHRVPGFKIGGTDTDETGVDPDSIDREPGPDEEAAERAFVEQFLPAGAGPTMERAACVLAHSPDGDYIVDRLPDRQNAVVAVGLSGHGFKTAPVIGEVAACLATGSPPPVDAAPFALDRFEEVGADARRD
jgi:sarcosine oxidase